LDTSVAVSFLESKERDGEIDPPWSESVKKKVGRGLLAGLRDYGCLEGRKTKTIRIPVLEPAAAGYVAFILAQRLGRGDAVLDSDQWRIFLRTRQEIEQTLMQADVHGTLSLQLAGSVARLDFPAEELSTYAEHIASQLH
jgi:hypothetical protein